MLHILIQLQVTITSKTNNLIIIIIYRPANSHGSAVSLTIFCHFSRSHDKALISRVLGKNPPEMK